MVTPSDGARGIYTSANLYSSPTHSRFAHSPLADMAPERGTNTPTWTTLFLELLYDTNTVDDPAPFCWAEFQEQVTEEIPPWSPKADKDNCPHVDEAHISAIQEFARSYCRAGPNRAAFFRESVNNSRSVGRAAMTAYLGKATQRWRLNHRFDEAMAEQNLSIYHRATKDLTKVSEVLHTV